MHITIRVSQTPKITVAPSDPFPFGVVWAESHEIWISFHADDPKVTRELAAALVAAAEETEARAALARVTMFDLAREIENAG